MRHAQLKAFHHVALLGGFSRAAQALGLTQPAISEQVRGLERDHDVQLFRREGRRVALTGAGEGLFRLTERYFEVEGEIAGYLSEARAAPAGRLRLIVDSAHHLTGYLSGFRARHPRISLHLRSGNTEEVIAALKAYEADIGLAGSQNFGREMEVLELGASPIIGFAARGLIAGAEAGLDLADILSKPLVLREKGSKTRARLEREAARLGLPVKPAIEAEGREAVREIVASGAGVGFVSRAEFGHDPRLVAIPVLGREMAMHESLISLRARREVRGIRAFMDFVAHAQARGLHRGR